MQRLKDLSSKAILEPLGKFRDYIRISRVGGLVRRYFIMNGFDGALTTLGVVLGSWFGGVQDPRIVFGLGLSAGIAMAVSGAWGAMISERAERLKSKKDLEKALFTKLDGSVIDKASNFAIILVSLIDAVSPLAFSLAILAPYAISGMGMLSISEAFQASMVVGGICLFGLGFFLGRISKENPILHGLLMLLAGVLLSLIILLIGVPV